MTTVRPEAVRLRQLVPRRVQPAARRLYLRVGPATSRYRMSPSFLVIGGQRCGTTSIFKALAAHPQVMRPPVEKGTDYYTLHHSRGLAWYRGHFPMAAPAALRTVGRGGAPQAFEACTYYLFHPLAIPRIADDFPAMRLVAMLRDPVERAYSAYKHELARGFETEPDFEKALLLEDERLAGELDRIARDPDVESHPHRHQAYLRRGRYAEQLERVHRYFLPEQLHVMESERFFTDPEGEFLALLEFLGLRPWLPAAFGRHNARPGEPMPPAARALLEDYYREPDEHLADLLHRRPAWKD
jgi:hypothetical protein